MKRLTFTGIVLAVVMAPVTALAQLPIDMTTPPEKSYGGPWPWVGTVGIACIGFAAAALVTLLYFRKAPRWLALRTVKAAAGPPAVKTAPPALAPPVSAPAPTPAPAAVTAAPTISAEGADDVYGKTLQDLLAKGVPQKAAEARAKIAAKKAGG